MGAELVRSGILLCLVGPAGAGKTTLCDHLLAAFPGCKLSVSVTSRAARAGEVQGRSYFFVSRAEFEGKIKRAEFFEFEEVHGNFYGTLKETLEGSIRDGVDLLLDVDIKGALNIKQAHSANTVVVFIAPPSGEELQRRILGRGDVSKDDLVRRLETAKREYQTLLKAYQGSAQSASNTAVDYLVVNQELAETQATLVSILRAERQRLRRLEGAELKSLLEL